ncbi:GNAT family N-acetyltransferase [Flaviflexus massiliensis]|uniref:GNAT family N-acetyltransferase n=1 Tax=Flaviflexus massiliensis TaxID=1522309 RepID=UPI0006D54973|nr:GNAT family N-acetyltransferase [Flaviflexus massiliensis]
MPVELITAPTPEVIDAINELLPQLTSTPTPLSEEQVEAFFNQDRTFFFAFRNEETGKINGMLTLATFIIPTGLRAWIEDVVVSEEARGQGAGQALIEEAIAYADHIGARSVDLTSRPSREAANRLYRRCGFIQRETNVYRYKKQS